ncbi:MAG: hypothetical protein ACJA08_002411 [Cyclobacteriaceae bacterium]|jgi:hypothetical protein
MAKKAKKVEKAAQKPTGNATENKYQEGAVVCERVHPYRKMKILRYFHRRYYCVLVSDPDGKEFTLDEREIMSV